MAAQARFPSTLGRQARGVKGVYAGADVVVTGGVAYRPRQVPNHDGIRPHESVRTAGDASEGAFHTEQTRIAGRDAYRATTVASGGQTDQTTGHRSRRSTRGAPHRAAMPPRVVGHPVDLGDA